MPHWFLEHGWASSWSRLAIAGAVTVAFAVVARALRAVTRPGAAAGGAACLLLYASAGPPAFATLAVLFLFTWISTRLGYRRKRELGVAERGEGRSAWQVLANLGVSALCALVFGITGNRLWLVASAAALAEAAADTVASEIGQTHGQNARLITNWKSVPHGTDGGVTLLGTAAGFIAGLAVAAIAAFGGMIPVAQFWIPVAAGFAGMLVDSLLGATYQRRGWMSNEAVNLLSTLAAAALALAISISTRPL